MENNDNIFFENTPFAPRYIKEMPVYNISIYQHAIHAFSTPGIYFLFNGDEIVYIGSSLKSIGKRIASHCNSEMVFDGFSFFFEDDADWDYRGLEKELIISVKPKYNSINKWNFYSKKK